MTSDTNTEQSTIHFTCVSCGQKLEATLDLIGYSVDCPKCNLKITVPGGIRDIPKPEPIKFAGKLKARQIIVGGTVILVVLLFVFKGYSCGKKSEQETGTRNGTTSQNKVPRVGAVMPRQIPTAYRLLASTLSQELITDPQKPALNKSFAQKMAEIRTISSELRSVKGAPQDVAAACQQAAELHSSLADQMDYVNALPKPPGMWQVVAESFARGCVGDLIGVVRRSNEVETQYKAAYNALNAVAVTWERIETSKLMLPRLAARYAMPPTQSDQWLIVEFDESFGCFGPDDWIALVNNSGVELHDATIMVELTGKSGEYRQNVHFLPSWPKGQAVYGRYSGGTALTDQRVVDRQTVQSVQDINVTVWSDRLSLERKKYRYAGGESDKDIKRYCKDLAVWSSYRPFSSGFFFDTHRGVQLTLKGIGYVYGPRLTIDFFRGGEKASWYWDFNSWSQNETITCDTGGKLAWDPEKYTVHLTFPYATTSYEWTGTWEVK